MTEPENTPAPPPVIPRAATSTTSILRARAVPTSAVLRDELEAMVVRELLGPAGGEEEEIDEVRVRDRYLVGMLAPSDVQHVPEESEDEELATAEDGLTEEVEVVQKPTFHPSSLGLMDEKFLLKIVSIFHLFIYTESKI